MKTIVTCAGIAAVGVVGLQAQDSVDSAPARPFSLSAKVRGFYDDNYATVPTVGYGSVKPRSSWGVDVAPSVGYTLLQDQTTLRLSYDFDYRWFADRVNSEGDMAHNFGLSLDHRFSERYKLEVFDSFVIGQEPALLDPGQQASYIRTDGNNKRNYGGIGFLTNFSEKWGSRIGYQNTWYDYQEAGFGASRSALLDRMEHLATVDVRYQVAPDKLALLGYQFGYVDQTSKDSLTLDNNPNSPGYVAPSMRNRRSHYAFLGFDQDLTSRLSYKARAGAQFAEYPNGAPGNKDTISPYADAMLQYRYAEKNQFQLGIKYGLNQTDVGILYGSNPADVTTDAESMTLFAGVMHYILPKLAAQARAQWQLAMFNNGSLNGQADNYYSADIGLTYEVNRNFALEAGYIFDRLDSDVTIRTYDRNQVYFGVRAAY